jgi:mevalonate kinase
MLFGEHAVVHDRSCIVTAVDQRLQVSVELLEQKQVNQLSAPEVGVELFEFTKDTSRDLIPKGALFVVRAYQLLAQKYQIPTGLKISTKTDFSSKFGFGSSSAVTVGITKALVELIGEKVTNEELFQLSYQTVLDVQGLGSGFDLASAIWGGTIYFETGGKRIEPLLLDTLPLIVGYTGVKADTVQLVQQVGKLHGRQTQIVERLFDVIQLIVLQAKEDILQQNWHAVGELMNVNQGVLESLGVNSLLLSKLIYDARNSGAVGAKLSGAGGGDCMLALSMPAQREKIEKSIVSAGGEVLHVQLHAPGVRLETELV